MMDALNLFIIAGSLIAGVMMLTGHGSVFMGGGNSQERKKRFDEKKMERASGIALVLVGIATAIDCITKTFAAKIIYMVVIVLIFAVLIIYIQKKCKIK